MPSLPPSPQKLKPDMSVCQPFTLVARWAPACLLVAALAGCGSGGGVTAEECQAAAGALEYGSLPATPGSRRLLETGIGQPSSSGRPTLAGAPAGCLADASFAVEGDSPPPGLTLDRASGQIAGVAAATGQYRVTISVSGPLLQPARYGWLEWQVRDPAEQVWTGWDDGTNRPRFAQGAIALHILGDRLVRVYDEPAGISTWHSVDRGASWQRDAPAHLPPPRRAFAVADDGGGRLIIAGGRDDNGLRDDVWAFDGSDWQLVADHAAFGPRAGARLFGAGGRLFLADGVTDALGLFELWRSDDQGRTWAAVARPDRSSSVRASLTCVAELGGRLVAVGSGFVFGTGSHPDSVAWTSDDGGTSWSEQALPGHSPFNSLNGGSGQCVSSNGRLFVVGSGGWWGTVVDIVSTRDFQRWDFQPRSEAFLTLLPVPGAVMLGDQLLLAFGDRLFATQR
jgi:hypothetical protein